ncbi:MAG TPA: hypothetical protein VH371_06225 [Candidatus Limnocylindrales bacterium]|jgi:hypothetical protein
MDAGPPTILIYPADDTAFRDHVERLLARGGCTPAALEEVLRHDYPAAAVHVSQVPELGMTWYVYRDGHWVGPSAR